ncbi:hypothetical protein RRG08_060964 [Elysia crispata]|uniref:Uncharacterized protein n=1 Tax=Elysia crispata TaxID=231223 RepID=A0AAE1E4P9_9GAST|nr:hypothetical protein RRG08_060964 [Elysia crispata]
MSAGLGEGREEEKVVRGLVGIASTRPGKGSGLCHGSPQMDGGYSARSRLEMVSGLLWELKRYVCHDTCLSRR